MVFGNYNFINLNNNKVKMKKILFTAALVTLLASCATITGQGNQAVKINTTPQGADVIIDGQRSTTPAVVTLKGASGYPIIAKKEGFKDGYGKVNGDVRILPAIVGNIFNLTGIIGMAVDFFATGAAYKLDQEVNIDLKTGTSTNVKAK
jgi:PEGA domain